jgi:hypothetical protein
MQNTARRSSLKPTVDAPTWRSSRISNCCLGLVEAAVVVNGKGFRRQGGSTATKMSSDDLSESADTHSKENRVHRGK